MGKKRLYHNLDGLLRDLVAAFDDDAEGWQRLIAMCRIIADVIDVLDDEDEDPGLPDPEGEAGGSGQLDLDLPDETDSSPLGGPAPGHGPNGVHQLGVTPGLGDPMERVRQLARQAAGVPSGAPALDATIVRRDAVSHHTRRRG